MVRLFTLVPERLAEAKDARGLLDLPGYFALARGTETLPPLEMTKWFDTNYHYLVPEIGAGTEIKLNLEAIDEQLEVAKQAGVKVRPQIVGPLTLLLGAKAEQGSAEASHPSTVWTSSLPHTLRCWSSWLSAVLSGFSWTSRA